MYVGKQNEMLANGKSEELLACETRPTQIERSDELHNESTVGSEDDVYVGRYQFAGGIE